MSGIKIYKGDEILRPVYKKPCKKPFSEILSSCFYFALFSSSKVHNDPPGGRSTLFGCTFAKVICTFLKSVRKDGFFDTPFDLIKENILHLIEVHRVGRVPSFFSSHRNWDSPNPSRMGDKSRKDAKRKKHAKL
jgi:hypothetical protein